MLRETDKAILRQPLPSRGGKYAGLAGEGRAYVPLLRGPEYYSRAGKFSRGKSEMGDPGFPLLASRFSGPIGIEDPDGERAGTNKS